MTNDRAPVTETMPLAVPTAEFPGAVSLSNGCLTTLLTPAGAGYTRWGDRAVTRWVPDLTCEASGYFIYCRDLETGQFWSSTVQPVPDAAERLAGGAAGDAVNFTRETAGIETHLSVQMSTTADIELRQCTVKNCSDRRRRIKLTSYLEFVLLPLDADAAHPAFSKLFLFTESDQEQGAILVHRRRRSNCDDEPWAAHWCVGGNLPDEILSHALETDRAKFIGRGRSLRNPAALCSRSPLSGTVGGVLDPIGALRRVVELERGEEDQVTFALAAAASREEVVRLLPQADPLVGSDKSQSDRLAVTNQSQTDRHFDTNKPQADDLSSPRPAEPHALAPSPKFTRCSGNRSRHISDPADPRPKSPSQNQKTPTPRNLLERRASPEDGGGGFRIGSKPRIVRVANDGRERLAEEDGKSEQGADSLEFDNGYGGFSADGNEYVIRIQVNEFGQRQLPPMPWINVIANPQFGFLVSETGAGYTWNGNSRENRLTPWSNDPICDPHGEAFYIRDEETGEVWSPMPGPVPSEGEYQVRHGFGYTRFLHTSHGVEHETTQFVARDAPVKITRLRLTNHSNRPRQLSFFSYAQWVLGSSAIDAPDAVQTEFVANLGAIFARNESRPEFASYVAFSAIVSSEEQRPLSPAASPELATGKATRMIRDLDLGCFGSLNATADCTAFLGHLGDLSNPRAVREDKHLDGLTGTQLDPCAALQKTIVVEPGESVECVFLLGEAASRDEAESLIQQYGRAGAACDALAQARGFWQDLLSRIEIETPSPALNRMLGGWLLYQDLSCRIWGRSAFYQSGGAFGYRDQIQDASALVHHWPELTREQILLHAAHQFEEGDVLHWWHPPNGRGLRTRFSDDLLWLPYVTAHYVQTTGDEDVLDEDVRFLAARPLADGEQKALLTPEEAGTSAAVFEHCCRAIDRSLAAGRHGLPKMGCGDWNDGMSHVGVGGEGESVWMGFFLYLILGDVIPWCEARGETGRTRTYRARRQTLHSALNNAGWDGAWYRRAYYDDGSPLGSAENSECRIDALSQAWAVLSGAAPPDRAAAAMQAALDHLVDEPNGLVRLLTPPFDKTSHDPGYIKGYLPGIRENDGQYTHGVLWIVRAMAQLGRGGKAVELLEVLNPIHHAQTTDEADTYKVEPYVVAADVYGEPPHVGRGGWTWYTGSAGWMYRIALESVLGVRIEDGKTLIVDPCIAPEWPRFHVRYRLPGRSGAEAGETRYDIRVENPHGKESGVSAVTGDGEPLEVTGDKARIPLTRDGQTHQIIVRM